MHHHINHYLHHHDLRVSDRRSRRRPLAIGAAFALAAVIGISACGQDESGDDTADGVVERAEADSDQGVDDVRYVATSAESLDIVEGSTIEISLGDGQLSAYAGCNRIFGQYRLEGTTLVAGPLASTRMACEPELMDQDAWLIRFLESEPELSLEAGEMVLTADTGVLVLSSEASSTDIGTEGDDTDDTDD